MQQNFPILSYFRPFRGLKLERSEKYLKAILVHFSCKCLSMRESVGPTAAMAPFEESNFMTSPDFPEAVRDRGPNLPNGDWLVQTPPSSPQGSCHPPSTCMLPHLSPPPEGHGQFPPPRTPGPPRTWSQRTGNEVFAPGTEVVGHPNDFWFNLEFGKWVGSPSPPPTVVTPPQCCRVAIT